MQLPQMNERASRDRPSSSAAAAEGSAREGSAGFASGRRDGRRGSVLHGWHDDGEEASIDRPGRLHEHSSAQARHEQKRREKSQARRKRNEITTNASIQFAAKMQRARKGGVYV